MAASQLRLLHLLLLVFVGTAFAEFEVIADPNITGLVCDQSFVAWENNTAEFYLLLGPRNRTIAIDNVTNVTFEEYGLQVLSGSHPKFLVLYFENDLIENGTSENGSRGRPVICATPPSDRRRVNLKILVIIYITSSLAIIASAISLITYTLFKKLRTLPGLVIMNLFASFLLGDIMLQIRIGHEHHNIMSVESITLHQGLLLARFVWMSITGFEMCRSLYNGVRLIGESRPNQTKILLATYMSIGWGVPTLLTVIMYSVEKSDASDIVKMVFGVVGYVTNSLPIGVTQLMNIGVVVFISVVIFNAARRQRRLRSSFNKQGINFTRLFIILLTVLGLVWLLFFLLQSDKLSMSDPVMIIYIILTSTQPIFVCIAFVCTKKVYRMYLVLLGLRKEAELGRRSTRQGTLTSMYSEKDLQRGRTLMSMISEKELNLPQPQRISPQLGTIEEGDEENECERPETLNLEEKEKIDSTIITELSNSKPVTTTSNGTSVNGAPNGTVVGNRHSSPTGSMGSLNPDREETNV